MDTNQDTTNRFSRELYEQIRFDGCGSLDNLEICHETEDENFKRLFFRIPSLFLGASVANPQCRLKSIEIDAGDSRRASSLLTSVQSALSVGYSKLEMFSLKFDGSYHSEDGFHLLSDIKQLVNTQPHLYTVNVSFPEKLPPIGDDVETVEGYTEFIMVIEKYMQRPHFECLILRDLLTFERAKQIIHTFLSLPLSSDTKLLDIRSLDDIITSTSQPDTIPEDQGKILMISNTNEDSEECLTPAVFQMLCNARVHCFEVIDNMAGIVSALILPIESLNVKKLYLTVHKVSVAPAQLRFRRFWPESRHFSYYISRNLPYQGHYSSFNRKQLREIKETEFKRIDKLIGNPYLLALSIRFQSTDDYIPSSQVSNILSTISDGLQLQSCSLQSLTLPKLECPLENDGLKRFFHCVFSLPHIGEFELNLTFVKFSLQSAEIIRSCHCESGGKMLAKFSLHYDSIIGNGHESSESLRTLLNDICKDFDIASVHE